MKLKPRRANQNRDAYLSQNNNEERGRHCWIFREGENRLHGRLRPNAKKKRGGNNSLEKRASSWYYKKTT